MRPTTIKNRRSKLLISLKTLDNLGVLNVSEIMPDIIYKAFELTTDKYSFVTPMREFLRYLHKVGALETDYSEFVPSVRKKQPIPSVYTKAETEKFLGGFNVETPTGLRNLAIALLALRLGMRSGDIANLKLSDVNFQTRTISFVQSKTQVAQDYYFSTLYRL